MLTLTTQELDELRADTPALAAYAHFAHGSISLPPRPVFDQMQNWLALEQKKGTHRASNDLREELTQVRETVAAMIGARHHQIAFLDSASRAWAMALAAASDNVSRLDVITTEHEWGGTAINLLHACAQQKISMLEVVNEVESETLAVTLGRALDAYAAGGRRTNEARLIVSFPGVSALDGRIMNAGNLASEVRRHEGLLFVDASHLAGREAIDVAEIGCDVLVFPARKWLRGPKGISVLYLSDRALGMLGAPPTLDIASAHWRDAMCSQPRDDASRFEVYEYHPGLRLALKAACDYAAKVGIGRIDLQNRHILFNLRELLQSELNLYSLENRTIGAFLTYEVLKGKGAQLLAALNEAGINASVVGKQYALWSMDRLGLTEVLRLTPHYVTSERDIEDLLNALRRTRHLLA